MNFYPAIDIMDGAVVRLKQGKAEERIGYHSDPVAQASIFEEQGATHLHVVDLNAAFGTGQNAGVISDIVKATNLKVQTGGGLRQLADVARVFDSGVWRAVIGSAAVQNPDLVAAATERHGAAICVGLDAHGGEVKIKGWTEGTSKTVAEVGHSMAKLGVATIVYTDISRDGMLGDPDIAGSVALARATGCTVVVSGGVSRLEHIGQVAANPDAELLDGVIVGRALYEECFTVADAMEAIRC